MGVAAPRSVPCGNVDAAGQSLSRLRRQLPLHKGAFASSSSVSFRALFGWRQCLPLCRNGGQEKPPLCKGRWHGEAVTEGL